jgi:uncharacterized membrane protein HdeD (DUF308 family)
MDVNHVPTESDVLRSKWTLLLFTGIIIVTLSTIALFMVRAPAIGGAVFAGWILTFIGMIKVADGFRLRLWPGFYLHLIGSVLGILIALIVFTNPLNGGLTWRLLFASFLTAVGLIRLIAAIRMKFKYWVYVVIDGIVTLGLGILLWPNWPSHRLLFVGSAVAVFVVLRGLFYVLFLLGVQFRIPVP